MAKLPLLLLLITAAAAPISAANDGLLQSEKPAPRRGREKLSHLRFYWHDVASGPKPTTVFVARAATSNTSATGFGTVNIIDDPMTVGPELTSKLVGRAQGLYASDSLEEPGLIMAMNLAFVDGKYNGSTLAVQGRNLVLTAVREMAIVGGSGLFRFARGYVQARTYFFNTKTGDATVEYNAFVTHY